MSYEDLILEKQENLFNEKWNDISSGDILSKIQFTNLSNKEYAKKAAEAIQSLQTSKHTQRRARQRLSAKNRTYRKEIQNLQNKIHKLKNELKQYKEEN